MDVKELEIDCSCLMYISRTYRLIVDYLKGIHLTLDSWRTGRNVDGWKLSSEELRELNGV